MPTHSTWECHLITALRDADLAALSAIVNSKPVSSAVLTADSDMSYRFGAFYEWSDGTESDARVERDHKSHVNHPHFAWLHSIGAKDGDGILVIAQQAKRCLDEQEAPTTAQQTQKERMQTIVAFLADDWQRRSKWEAFYAGSFAPHKPEVGTDPIEALPWRSKAPTSQLVEHLRATPLPANARCIELGCGTGENLSVLAGAAAFACGVDVVADAVSASKATLGAAGITNGQAVHADILALHSADVAALADGGGWAFDFLFDASTFHCVRRVDAQAAARAYSSLVRAGGSLLMLTGNADEADERGPDRLTRDEVLHAFDGTALVCESCEAVRYDWTEAYRRQPFEQPPLGWLSLWRSRPESPTAWLGADGV